METLINYQTPDYKEWGSLVFPWTQQVNHVRLQIFGK